MHNLHTRHVAWSKNWYHRTKEHLPQVSLDIHWSRYLPTHPIQPPKATDIYKNI